MTYYRDTVRSISLLLFRNAASAPLPGLEVVRGDNWNVRLWRFTNNRFECVFEIPWDELPLRDNSLPENATLGSPCGHSLEEDGLSEEERREAWSKQFRERLKQYKPVDLDSWDGYSDVWTAPPWIHSVSMLIHREGQEEGLGDVLHAGRRGNVEDGGTLVFKVME